jgi:ubiquinone/menaquinone biosynthesis C-methylase UbiE
MHEERPYHSSTADIWDHLARDYDAARVVDPIYLAAVSQIVRDSGVRTERVLDAGCGTGMVTRRIVGKRSHVWAVDFSSDSLDELTRTIGARGYTTLQCDIRSMPFRNGFFDTVICANTLQHFTPDQQIVAVRELMRVLSPGGRYAVSVHHHSKAKAHWNKEGPPGQAGIDYIYRFSRNELASLFPSAKIRAVGFNTLYRLGPLSYVGQCVAASTCGHTLAKAGYGHMLIAYGEKH